MESLAAEVEPFGIRAMLVVPGSFRTELLTGDSLKWPEPSIDDYAESTRQRIEFFKQANGVQVGDAAKLAAALLQLAAEPGPPLRWPAGVDAVETFEKKADELQAQANAYRALSTSLEHEAVAPETAHDSASGGDDAE